MGIIDEINKRAQYNAEKDLKLKTKIFNNVQIDVKLFLDLIKKDPVDE